ncbi:MAG TPA: tetratricopeptide repeat protein, partial [Geobacteraceae bacterium]
ASDTYRSLDLRRFFTTAANGLEYLPLRDVSFALDYLVWGMDPRGFHLTNLVLYLFNIFAVYYFAATAARFLRPAAEKGDGDTRFVAFWCAALFAVHPLHSQVVSFVTCRNTLLSGLFTFLAAAWYLRFLTAEDGRRHLFYAATLGAYVLALFSKGTSIFLPLFFLPCVFLGGRKKLTALISLAPFVGLAAGASWLFTTIARDTNVIDAILSRHGGLAAIRLLEAVQIPFFYLGKLVVPLGLSADYDPLFAHALATPAVAGALVAIVVLAAAAVYFARRLPVIPFALCWYAASLIPVLHLIPTSTTVADRYAYLPSFAFFFLIASGGAMVRQVYPRRICAVVAGIIGAGWAFLAFAHNRVWHDDVSLWEHTAQVSPRSLTALDNLGWIYFTRGELAKAGNYFQRALLIDPGDPLYAFFQGYLAFDRKDYAKALTCFKDAYAKRNDLIEAIFYIGQSYEAIGDRKMASEYYRYVLGNSAPEAVDYRRLAAERLQRVGGDR